VCEAIAAHCQSPRAALLCGPNLRSHLDVPRFTASEQRRPRNARDPQHIAGSPLAGNLDESLYELPFRPSKSLYASLLYRTQYGTGVQCDTPAPPRRTWDGMSMTIQPGRLSLLTDRAPRPPSRPGTPSLPLSSHERPAFAQYIPKSPAPLPSRNTVFGRFRSVAYCDSLHPSCLAIGPPGISRLPVCGVPRCPRFEKGRMASRRPPPVPLALFVFCLLCLT